MMSVDQEEIFNVVKAGVDRVGELVWLRTDKFGGRVGVEYLMTADIARQLITRECFVSIEPHYRKMANVLAKRKDINAKKVFGRKRADIAVTDSAELVLHVIIEIKTNCGFGALRKDMDRILLLFSALSAKSAARILGVLVFEVHVAANIRNHTAKELIRSCSTKESRRESQLNVYAKENPGFHFKLRPLQDKGVGIVPSEIEDRDGEKEIGRPGHATRYHAILIRKA